VENVAYTSGGRTVNITYTAVSGLDQRNTAGFEVCHFCISSYQDLFFRDLFGSIERSPYILK
jgi:hypothetical protein